MNRLHHVRQGRRSFLRTTVHFDMLDAHYYQIPLGQQRVSLTVNPGQTVAIREVAMNPRKNTP